MLHLVSETAKLELVLDITGSGSAIPYQFSNLLPATDYVVSAVGDGIPVTYYNNVTDIAQATKVTVQAGQDTANINFTFTATAKNVSGKITEGTPGVSGAPVFALETNTMALYSVLSDGTGNYTLKLPAGSYIVFTFKASNGKTFYYRSAGTTQLDTQAEVIPITTTNKTGINIDIAEPTCKIGGQVTYRSEGGNPVEGIMVFGEGPKGTAIGVTDQAGQYALTGLTCNDTYSVTIYPEAPYPPQTKSAAATASATLNFVINVGWVLSGTVAVQGTGTPIPGAWVYLLNSQGRIAGMPALTDGQGQFTLADIQTGVYTLVAEHSDYQTVEVPNLAIEYDMTGYAVAMTPGVSIAGVVKDDATNPLLLPGVLVIATAVGEDSRYAMTDNLGAYEVGGLVNAKTYFLVFVKPGYLKQVQSTTAPQAAFNVTLVAPAAKVSFSGTVQLQGGAGIQGAIVIIQSASKNYYDAATTGANGAFSFSDVIASNDYKLTVIPGNNRPVYVDPQTLDLSGPGPVSKTITIPVGNITGTVHLSDSATGKTVVVYLLDSATGDWIADVTATDAGNGNYTYNFTSVPGGKNYKVCAFSTGYNLGWYGGTSFAAATNVQSGASSINFTLTK